jgi:alkylation response protein AidB-like acyl-CoA dehydrogenase
MEFGLSESQQMLKDNARKFFAGECPMGEVRRLMDTDTAYDAALWAKLAEQGYTGIIFAEEYGGVGLGKVELILLMEEAGRALLPGPLFSTVALAGAVISAVAGHEQKKKYLAPICAGEARSTVAMLEAGASWDPKDARISVANGRLTGEKLFVPDAAVADSILVVAPGGVFAVDGRAPGITIRPMLGMDLTRKLYSVRFENTPAERLGDAAGPARGLDIATAALAAEMVGGMQRTLDLTVEYAKMRKQFGKPIGSFQAVKHLCADMLVRSEVARAAVHAAAVTIDQPDVGDGERAAAGAGLLATEAALANAKTCIQVYGGMGFTWEVPAHLYLMRARALAEELDGADALAEVVAERY